MKSQKRQAQARLLPALTRLLICIGMMRRVLHGIEVTAIFLDNACIRSRRRGQWRLVKHWNRGSSRGRLWLRRNFVRFPRRD